MRSRSIFGLALVLSCLASPAGAAELSGDIAFVAGDYSTAWQVWHREAEHGDASAMAAIGTLYDTGHGVRQDFAQALAWYRRAAQAGNARAMFNVAAMLDAGRGTARNLTEAIVWYRLAAFAGNARAAYDLGTIYRDGDGVAADRIAAIRFFRMAAAGGIAAARPALVELGAPEPPHPVPPTPPAAPPQPPPLPPAAPAAPEDFQSAVLARHALSQSARQQLGDALPGLRAQAAQGDARAEYDVGVASEFGIGTAPDAVQAYVHYLRASASGDPGLQAAALAGAAATGDKLDTAQHQAARDLLLETGH